LRELRVDRAHFCKSVAVRFGEIDLEDERGSTQCCGEEGKCSRLRSMQLEAWQSCNLLDWAGVHIGHSAEAAATNEAAAAVEVVAEVVVVVVVAAAVVEVVAAAAAVVAAVVEVVHLESAAVAVVAQAAAGSIAESQRAAGNSCCS
jgi:hypothetical protein